VGTLASELGPHAERLTGQPRVYIDANVPIGLVSFMRTRLQWDVLFVMEHDDLRRASDDAHFHLARQLRRTLITFDRDYLDDRRFPTAESGGVVVLSAPDEGRHAQLLKRLDAEIFRTGEPAIDGDLPPLPLAGKKLHIHVDWAGVREPLR
jgi:hypothetical protein